MLVIKRGVLTEDLIQAISRGIKKTVNNYALIGHFLNLNLTLKLA
jgi:hypothetical protein